MSVTPGLSSENKVLGGIVVHTVSVLAANDGNNILLPLYNMLANPSALVVSGVILCFFKLGTGLTYM